MGEYEPNHASEYRECVRCGRRRRVKRIRQGELCGDCKSVLTLSGQLHLWIEKEAS